MARASGGAGFSVAAMARSLTAIRDLVSRKSATLSMGSPFNFTPQTYASGQNIGGGAVIPLSTVYSSLAAAQAVFPRATALTESLAWHCVARAIADAKAAGGGTVSVAEGRYTMSPCPGALNFPLCVDGAAVSQQAVDPDLNCQVNFEGRGMRKTFLEWTAEVPGDFAVVFGSQPGDPYGLQVDSRYGAFKTSVGEMSGMMLIGPARTLLNGNNTAGTRGCRTHGIAWASRRKMRDVYVSWFNRGLDLVGDHTDFNGCQFTHNFDGVHVSHASPTMYGDISFSGKPQFRLNRRSCFAIENTALFGPMQMNDRPFVGTSPFGFYKKAPRATTTTDATGYAVGATVITLATGATGVIEDRDFVQFAGDSTRYQVLNGNYNVAAGGTITLMTGLTTAIPAATTAITVNPNITLQSGLLTNCQFDSMFFESLGNAAFWDGRVEVHGQLPAAVLQNVSIANMTISSFSDTYKLGPVDRTFMHIGDAVGLSMTGLAYQNVWTGVTLPVFNFQTLNGDVFLSGNIELLLTQLTANTKQLFGLPSSAAGVAYRFRLQHTGYDTQCGPWEGRVRQAPAGNAIAIANVVGFTGSGVKLISATTTSSPIAGITRTASFPQNPPVSSPPCFVVVAEESSGGLPYVGSGTFTAGTPKRVGTTGGTLSDATATTDTVLGVASSTTRTSLIKSALGKMLAV